MSFSTMWSYTHSGSGCLLTQAELWPNKLVYKAWSMKWAANLFAVLFPHNHLSPYHNRVLRKLSCFLIAVNKFTKAEGLKTLVICIIASITVGVALIPTPAIYLFINTLLIK